MADLSKRVETNVEGRYFVDSTCIDCEACRWVAPESFAAIGTQSYVYRQPETDAEEHRAKMAILACPVACIGTEDKVDMKGAIQAYPDPVEEPDRDGNGVYYCGYNAESSYGAASWFIKRPEGNVLVDSPRYATQLAKRIEALGGIDYMFLSHIDDVADHERWADNFGCLRVMHTDDVRGYMKDVEILVEGSDPFPLADDLLILPVPGHTRGSQVLIYKEKFCFTGDHLWWNPDVKTLRASPRVAWYDWDEQVRSMERLADWRFEYVLPGHGQPSPHVPAEEMKEHMTGVIDWMKNL